MDPQEHEELIGFINEAISAIRGLNESIHKLHDDVEAIKLTLYRMEES
jgi:hypothetical protein